MGPPRTHLVEGRGHDGMLRGSDGTAAAFAVI
jgi:hypothetical protein